MPVVDATGMLVPPQNPQILAVWDRGDFHCAVTFHSQENSHISKDKWGMERALPNSAHIKQVALGKGLICN